MSLCSCFHFTSQYSIIAFKLPLRVTRTLRKLKCRGCVTTHLTWSLENAERPESGNDTTPQLGEGTAACDRRHGKYISSQTTHTHTHTIRNEA